MKVYKLLFCIVIGYLLGSLSPAALFAKIKGKNLRKNGTGNLGATNTMLVIGKAYGVAVMLLDMSKAILAVLLANVICSTFAFAGIAAGCAAVVGHIFPLYLKFKGGKGLAPYAGMILALDPMLFLLLLIFCVSLMVIVNYSVALPWSAGILFPTLSIFRTDDIAYLCIAAAVSLLIIIVHFPNFLKAVRGKDVKIRDYLSGKYKKQA